MSKMLLFSKYHFNQRIIIFAISLQSLLVSEMEGKYDGLLGFGMGTTR